MHRGDIVEYPSITKQVRRNRAYYTIDWSVLQTVARNRINAGVPALPGLWEIYWLQHSRIPRLLKIGTAWRGGLRSTLRTEADPERPANREIGEYLASGDCYFHFTVCEDRDDLVDVYWVLASLRNAPVRVDGDSGRYRDVRIKEPEELRINRVRTPEQKPVPTEPFGDRVPNMFDVMRAIAEIESERDTDG